MDDALSDFTEDGFTYQGRTRRTFRIGSGPAVIVMAEMPGISPRVATFARRVADIGCTAVVPHLFGLPGRDPNPDAHGALGSAGYALSSLVPACISREFAVLATGRTSPVVGWLRALAAAEHERCGGPGVGAVGIDISPADLDAVKHRCAKGDLEVLGLRFTGDKIVPRGRFEFLRRALGEAFVAIELPNSAANPDGAIPPHSVLTEHLIDEPGQPTRDALDTVLDLFRKRLLHAA